MFLALCLTSAAAIAQPLSTTFTYQGSLSESGVPANGIYDLRFRLYDQAASPGGVQIGPTLCVEDLVVVDGIFTTQLDFGSAFSGQRRFIEVGVRPGNAGTCAVVLGYTTLLPRQEVTAAPNAAFSLTSASASNSTSLNGQPATFYTNASNLTSGTIPDSRLSANVTTNSLSQTITGTKTFATPPNFSGGSSPFTVSGNGLVTNLNADLLDGLNSSAFAPASHTHDASALISGTLADARLASNIARLASPANFTTLGVGTTTPSSTFEVRAADPQARVRNINDVGGAMLLNTFGSMQLGMFNPTDSAWNSVPANGYRSVLAMDSLGRVGSTTNTSGGPVFRNLLDDGSGRLGVGTSTPGAPLDVRVNATQGLQFRLDGGVVPGINVVGTGGNAGIVRLRNNLEIHPSDDATRAGRLDVRNTSGTATITLNGATGDATYNNQPAIKTVESPIGVSANISNDSLTLIEEASVTIPGDGFLHITAQAPVFIDGGGSSTVYLELKETTGVETLIDENWVGVLGTPTVPLTERTIVSLSHTIPVTAGVRRFKIRLRHSGTFSTYAAVQDPANSNGRVRTSVTLMYFPRGL
jgi:hypothetical protein